MRYTPDYHFSYIEATIQACDLRGLTITPGDVLEGLRILDAAGFQDIDAETALRNFLYRTTPFHRAQTLEHERFPGWDKISATLAHATNEGLARQFGMDACRVGAVLRHRGQMAA